MAFELQLTDNTNTVDFLSSDFKVLDGGFDISLPSTKRELAVIRDGFYIPVSNMGSYREATIQFSIYGATRAALIANLNKIYKIMDSVHRRARMPSGSRGQLKYKWDGASYSTFFELYGMDFNFPQDVLSVEKIHRVVGGLYEIPGCELKLYLSSNGYGLSIYSDVAQQIQLANALTAKTSNAVVVNNPSTGHCNYVQIDGADLANHGDTPLITQLQLENGSTYSVWYSLYMGLVTSDNYPTKIIYDSTELSSAFGTEVTSSGAEGGEYNSITWNGSTSFQETFAGARWQVSNNSVGIFHTFMHAVSDFPTGYSAAIGIDDYVSYGIRYVGSYVKPGYSTQTLPLGVLSIPPFDFEIAKLGTLQSDLEIGIFSAGSSQPMTVTLDFLSLLPIMDGFRALHTRIGEINSLTGTFYDDGWKGLTYIKRTGPTYATPLYGTQDFLKLIPGKNQRIYFQSVGGQAQINERDREFKIKLYIVPTFGVMAL